MENRHHSLYLCHFFPCLNGAPSSHGTVSHVSKFRCGQYLKNEMFWVLSREKTLDWWLTLVCVGLFYTCYMEFGWVNVIWLRCASFVASLWLIQPCFSCSLIHGLHTFHAFFSTLLKTLMLLSQLKCFVLVDDASSPPTPPPNFILLRFFRGVQFAHTSRTWWTMREMLWADADSG